MASSRQMPATRRPGVGEGGQCSSLNWMTQRRSWSLTSPTAPSWNKNALHYIPMCQHKLNPNKYPCKIFEGYNTIQYC
ncbi:unnamed protein product [Colias eurytheme]|nr:unnamed protein product [Colias eurytheme]